MGENGSVKWAGAPRLDLSCIVTNTEKVTCFYLTNRPASLTEISAAW